MVYVLKIFRNLLYCWRNGLGVQPGWIEPGPLYVTSGKGKQKTVRSYSTRFEALLGKLPSFNQDWAKTQFIWGLHSCVAELVTIAGPADLHLAIRKAEEIEMARTLASGGQTGQKMSNQNRGRGRVPTRTWSIQRSANSEYWSTAEYPNAAITALCSTVSSSHQCRRKSQCPML